MRFIIAGVAAALAAAPAVARAEAASVGELVVVGASLTDGVPAGRVAAQVRTVGEADLVGAADLAESLSRRFGGADEMETVGGAYQRTLTLRGASASPILGEPQGVSVYQDGMRLNEAFGDVVQWDLTPTFAIDRAQVIAGSHPTYGLNTTGGAVVITMKDGFSGAPVSAEVEGGSFGLRRLLGQGSLSGGPLGAYAGVETLEEDGWRDASPSRITRGYADFAWRPSARTELGIGLTAATSELTGNGPAPADLLAARRQAVFTYPDVTESTLYAAVLRGSVAPSDNLTLGGSLFARELTRATFNGDQAEFEECDEFAGLVPGFTAPDDAICFGAEVEDGEVEGDPQVLVDVDGAAVVSDDEPGAVFNRTRTRTRSRGLAGQLKWTGELAGRQNILIAGLALEAARTRYGGGAELGTLLPDRGVEGLGVDIGNSEFSIGLVTKSRSAGLYVSDTVSLTSALHLSGSMRWNRSELTLRDQIGTALNGDHTFERVNVGTGLAWNAARNTTLYVAYAGNSRAPTPAELSCADPATPCRFPNAFLADPPLDEVKAHTLEIGGRGSIAGVRWSASAFRTNLADDIIFISAGPIVGTGYFDNVGDTRRQGFEADAEGALGTGRWYASYGYTRATYQTTLAIQAPDNPHADERGEIVVSPGDRIPGIPAHSLKIGAEWEAMKQLKLGFHLRTTSSRYLRGDEANLTRPLTGFATLGASAAWARGPLELWVRAENLTDARHETFGLYGEADELGFDDPRFLSPGSPRAVFVGLRVRR